MLNMWCDYEIILLQKRLDIQHENIGEGVGGGDWKSFYTDLFYYIIQIFRIRFRILFHFMKRNIVFSKTK